MQIQLKILTVIVFLIWLLPLGFFIKPSQEKTACGGQRAICMCHVNYSTAQTAKPVEALAFKVPLRSANQMSPAGGGAGHYSVYDVAVIGHTIPTASLGERALLYYNNPQLASLEHVPRA